MVRRRRYGANGRQFAEMVESRSLRNLFIDRRLARARATRTAIGHLRESLEMRVGVVNARATRYYSTIVGYKRM